MVPVPSEQSEQVALASTLDRWGLLWCHVPNGFARGAAAASAAKRAGAKPGVPDALIFEAPPNLPDCFATFVELKRRTGGRTDAEQVRWALELRRRRWAGHEPFAGCAAALAWLQSVAGYGPGLTWPRDLG